MACKDQCHDWDKSRYNTAGEERRIDTWDDESSDTDQTDFFPKNIIGKFIVRPRFFKSWIALSSR